MQIFATDLIRQSFGDDFWIDALFRNNQNLSIHDVRFKNEIDAIINKGGIVIRLERGLSTELHQSETELKDYLFTHVYQNNGTILDLKNHLIEIIKTL